MNYWDLKPEAEFELAFVICTSAAFYVGYWLGEASKKIKKGMDDGSQKPDRRYPPA